MTLNIFSNSKHALNRINIFSCRKRTIFVKETLLHMEMGFEHSIKTSRISNTAFLLAHIEVWNAQPSKSLTEH